MLVVENTKKCKIFQIEIR